MLFEISSNTSVLHKSTTRKLFKPGKNKYNTYRRPLVKLLLSKIGLRAHVLSIRIDFIYNILYHNDHVIYGSIEVWFDDLITSRRFHEHVMNIKHIEMCKFMMYGYIAVMEFGLLFDIFMQLLTPSQCWHDESGKS